MKRKILSGFGLLLFACATATQAIQLGDVRVDSYIGQPLRASISLSSAEDQDSSEGGLPIIKIATVEEYEKLGQKYPYGVKFRFGVILDGAGHRFVSITSAQRIDDVYITLLLEASTPFSRIAKTFNLLLDPPPEDWAQGDTNPPIDKAHQSTSDINLHKAHDDSAGFDLGKRVAAGNESRLARASKIGVAKTKAPKGKLSIGSTAGSKSYLQRRAQIDAIDDDLIAKKKSLAELDDQIKEMRKLVESLQAKASYIAEKPLLKIEGKKSNDGLLNVESDNKSHKDARPGDQITTSTSAIIEGCTLALLFTWLGVVFTKRSARDLKKKVTPHEREAGYSVQPAIMASKGIPLATPMQSVVIKHPTWVADKDGAENDTSPECDLIEEARGYMDLGKTDHAEKILLEARKINHRNIDVHLSLMGIMASQGNLDRFDEFAGEAAPYANDEAQEKITRMRSFLMQKSMIFQ